MSRSATIERLISATSVNGQAGALWLQKMAAIALPDIGTPLDAGEKGLQDVGIKTYGDVQLLINQASPQGRFSPTLFRRLVVGRTAAQKTGLGAGIGFALSEGADVARAFFSGDSTKVAPEELQPGDTPWGYATRYFQTAKALADNPKYGKAQAALYLLTGKAPEPAAAASRAAPTGQEVSAVAPAATVAPQKYSDYVRQYATTAHGAPEDEDTAVSFERATPFVRGTADGRHVFDARAAARQAFGTLIDKTGLRPRLQAVAKMPDTPAKDAELQALSGIMQSQGYKAAPQEIARIADYVTWEPKQYAVGAEYRAHGDPYMQLGDFAQALQGAYAKSEGGKNLSALMPVLRYSYADTTGEQWQPYGAAPAGWKPAAPAPGQTFDQAAADKAAQDAFRKRAQVAAAFAENTDVTGKTDKWGMFQSTLKRSSEFAAALGAAVAGGASMLFGGGQGQGSQNGIGDESTPSGSPEELALKRQRLHGTRGWWEDVK